MTLWCAYVSVHSSIVETKKINEERKFVETIKQNSYIVRDKKYFFFERREKSSKKISKENFFSFRNIERKMKFCERKNVRGKSAEKNRKKILKWNAKNAGKFFSHSPKLCLYLHLMNEWNHINEYFLLPYRKFRKPLQESFFDNNENLFYWLNSNSMKLINF